MHPVRIPELTPAQLSELDEVYRNCRDVRLRTRIQMVLLAVEQHLTAAEIAPIVRVDQETVRRWLKRYLSEGTERLRDAPRPRAPSKVSAA